ncbi:UNVERIFIED_CONTAM: hypothetical protein FKN15_069572 [Acipenser sinensis]
MSSHHAKLVIPYGLKTLLEGVSRAVMKRQPENITKFASCYFTELVKFRDANPSLDIMGLENEFRQIHDLGSSFEEHRLGVAAFHNDSPASEEQGTHSNTYTFESGIVRSPYSDQDPNTRCAVQSVFERVPSGIYEATSNSVLLKTPDVPHEDVIIVHSENVPESLIFHKVKEESCTRQSLLGFDESTAKHKNAQDGESAPGKEYQAVAFQRVPSASQLATPSAAQETVNQDTPVNAVEHSSAEAPSLHRKTSISGVEVPPEKAEIEQECDLGSSFEEHRLGVAAFHNDSPASEEQGTHSNTYTFESGIVRSPYSDQDPNTRCAVQSVFERVPSGIYEATSNSVLLKTPDVPHEDVIIVHSENVPESLIFHKVKEESCTRQSLLGFDESTAKHKNAQDGESAPGKEYQAVAFQRVPSASQLATPSAAQETVNQDTPVNAVEHSSAEAPSLHRKTSISGVEVPPEKAEIEQECGKTHYFKT